MGVETLGPTPPPPALPGAGAWACAVDAAKIIMVAGMKMRIGVSSCVWC